MAFILVLKNNTAISKCFFNADLKVKHKDGLAVYNHTLSTTLVEYASAVSSASKQFFWHSRDVIWRLM